MSLIKYIRLLPAVVLLCISTEMSAQEFEVDGICYTNYGVEDGTCYVVDVTDKEEIIIPSTVKHKKRSYTVCEIEYNALEGKRELRSVTLPNTINNLSNCFNDCPSLAAINVDSQNANYASVDGVLYNKDKTKILRYPSGKQESSFTIPQTVSNICESAFSNCVNLENIILPEQLRVIGWWTFNGCSNLKSIRIPLSVEEIGQSAFADCVALTNIEIDEASPCFTFKDGVLYNKDMTAIICYPAGRRAQTYTVPASVGEIETVVFCGNPYLTNIIVDKNNPKYTSIDGVLYDKSLKTVVCCPSGKSMDSFSFPVTVNEIDDFAFYHRQESRVVIPDNIKEIGISSFGNSQNVTELIIGKSLEYATGVEELHNLKVIRVHRQSPPVFEDGAFFDEHVCRNAVLYVPKSSMKIYKKDEFWSQFKNIRALEK